MLERVFRKGKKKGVLDPKDFPKRPRIAETEGRSTDVVGAVANVAGKTIGVEDRERSILTQMLNGKIKVGKPITKSSTVFLEQEKETKAKE